MNGRSILPPKILCGGEKRKEWLLLPSMSWEMAGLATIRFVWNCLPKIKKKGGYSFWWADPLVPVCIPAATIHGIKMEYEWASELFFRLSKFTQSNDRVFVYFGVGEYLAYPKVIIFTLSSKRIY